ncbi:branched-chain amino acid permease [Enterococcus ureilyticus]|uniref:Branched-chain amino acid permease n=1 Tax=Enterococcus ureilyticus TaxID=1131292 RepID=A0A1E5H9S0_9ENTE|nr:AzlC family ABC transporter permease [Enterococcus ureilyticus]MBM7688371.1 4-azaleucine resistance transporter AzlC [Enterococcus ureilyticus]MBO0445037.1 AzlC family ABC transporter permease [Enterococcus ureilyticus]OEG21698.1 branched-chain amino acid permease [Enterococcus ureilyticus]
MEKKEYLTFKEGVYACIPTILGYLGIGIAAGVVGKNVGLSVLEIALMSILVYAGGAQFIICGMLVIHSPISAIIFTTFLVNLRHFLMSMSVASYFKKEPLITSIGIGTLLTDESYGVLMGALSNEHRVSSAWTHGLNITAYLAWIISTIVGGVLGTWIPDPYLLGLDFALVAMFAGLFVLQVDGPIKKYTKETLIVLGTVCVSLYLLMGFLSPELSVLFATLLGCTVGMVNHHE